MDDAREALRRAIVAEHRLHLEAQRCETEASRWNQRAELALRRGEAELARQALQRERAAAERAAHYHALYAGQAAEVRSAKVTFHASGRRLTPSIERRLEQLAEDDRLESDLAALKSQLGLTSS